ncbi:integumentary mucin A.1 [Drosophila tropicalis]|uniref:integumentary mucin A.1 n=1 Tax=Drosophila tropicalis TaxID=46794 RepID=UPI0035ABF44D
MWALCFLLLIAHYTTFSQANIPNGNLNIITSREDWIKLAEYHIKNRKTNNQNQYKPYVPEPVQVPSKLPSTTTTTTTETSEESTEPTQPTSTIATDPEGTILETSTSWTETTTSSILPLEETSTWESITTEGNLGERETTESWIESTTSSASILEETTTSQSFLIDNNPSTPDSTTESIESTTEFTTNSILSTELPITSTLLMEIISTTPGYFQTVTESNDITTSTTFESSTDEDNTTESNIIYIKQENFVHVDDINQSNPRKLTYSSDVMPEFVY